MSGFGRPLLRVFSFRFTPRVSPISTIRPTRWLCVTTLRVSGVRTTIPLPFLNRRFGVLLLPLLLRLLLLPPPPPPPFRLLLLTRTHTFRYFSSGVARPVTECFSPDVAAEGFPHVFRAHFSGRRVVLSYTLIIIGPPCYTFLPSPHSLVFLFFIFFSFFFPFFFCQFST